MSLVTLADAKAFRIPEVVNVPPSDARFLAYLNEASQLLLERGKWWGTYGRYRIASTSGYITYPKHIATVEAVAVCKTPVSIRDVWYEYLESGWGLRQEGDGIAEADYRGHFPTFKDIEGTNKKIRLLCDLSNDAGKTVLVLGYDENGNWVRTVQSGVMADGEVIVLAQSPGTLSNNKFSVITNLQAPSNLDGQWWLYEYNTADATQRVIGQYQYYDKRPSFARYLFPSIRQDASPAVTVEAICKYDFIPVAKDTDYVLPGHLPALKVACQGIKAREENRTGDFAAFMSEAVDHLDKQLDHYLGSGRRVGISLVGSSIGAVDPIPVFV